MLVRRVMPYPGRVLVELGQMVTPDMLVAETMLQPEEPIHLGVTEMFGRPPAEVLGMARVEAGMQVEAGQVVAIGELEGNFYEVRAPGRGLIEHISPLLGTISLRLEGDPNESARVVDVAKELEIPAIVAMQRILVSVGQPVRMGQTLATDPDEEVIAYAPIQGDVVDIQGAKVTIKRPFTRTEVNAFISGKVVEIVPEFGAVIESSMSLHHGVFGLGGERFGQLKVLVNSPEQSAGVELIGAHLADCIAVVGAYASEAVLHQCKASGVAGVIAGGCDSVDLVNMLGVEISPGLDMRNDLGFTLLLSEGMGSVPINAGLFACLLEAQGNVVSISGTTQIRAGVIRPCVYLPSKGLSSDANSSGLGTGAVVRCVRAPWFGQKGHIVEMLGLCILPSGIQTLCCMVELDDGHKEIVARSNLEPWTER